VSLASDLGQIAMTTSQLIMILALVCIAFGWAATWLTGPRAKSVQHIFASLCLQALAAILLSFSSANLPLSLTLAAIILSAIIWMVRSGSDQISSPQETRNPAATTSSVSVRILGDLSG
jgi:hypothetical protein